MGWTTMPRPRSVREYLEDNLTWETDKAVNKCLVMALKINVMYAAVETIQKENGERKVWAAVYLIRYFNGEDQYNFGYKSMSEHMGPCQADCPERILDLLTDSDSDDAKKWRERCRDALDKRMPKAGTRVLFVEPIRFNGGSEESEFTVVKVGRRKKVLRGVNGGYFRISRRLWQDRDWSVVP